MVWDLSCRWYGVTEVFDQGSGIVKAVSGRNVRINIGKRKKDEMSVNWR